MCSMISSLLGRFLFSSFSANVFVFFLHSLSSVIKYSISSAVKSVSHSVRCVTRLPRRGDRLTWILSGTCCLHARKVKYRRATSNRSIRLLNILTARIQNMIHFLCRALSSAKAKYARSGLTARKIGFTLNLILIKSRGQIRSYL